MSLAKVLIGTSGYSFADWVGPFYPEKIPKGKMLDYYKDHFQTVEINSTYYRIPHPAVFYNMQKKVAPEFEFIIKTHRSFTHDRKTFKDNIAKIDDVRKKMIVELKQLEPEITFEATTGAYYFFVNVMAIEKDDIKLAWDLLETEKVLTIPGSAFGNRGKGYLRLSYGGTDEEKMVEGVKRIKKYVKKMQ